MTDSVVAPLSLPRLDDSDAQAREDAGCSVDQDIPMVAQT